jgi:hypothetical protein
VSNIKNALAYYIVAVKYFVVVVTVTDLSVLDLKSKSVTNKKLIRFRLEFNKRLKKNLSLNLR